MDCAIGGDQPLITSVDNPDGPGSLRIRAGFGAASSGESQPTQHDVMLSEF